MAYSVRRSADGGDRRRGRSLAETLTNGNMRSRISEDDLYDEATGPHDMTRRPAEGEWNDDDTYTLPTDRNR